MAAAKATGDLLLFADARQTFAADAIKKLVRHFNDSSVVAVSGQLFPHGSIGGASKGIDFYWKLESPFAMLKQCMTLVLVVQGPSMPCAEKAIHPYHKTHFWMMSLSLCKL